MDGDVYTHPLVVPGINFAGQSVTGVIVATQNNYVRFMHDLCPKASNVVRGL